MRTRAAIVLAIVAVVPISIAHADGLVGKDVRVKFKDDARKPIEGRVVSEDDESITLRIANGMTRVERSEIAVIVDAAVAAKALRDRLAAAKTVDECRALAAELAKAKDDPRPAYRAALVIDPENEWAHAALGHERHEGDDGKPRWWDVAELKDRVRPARAGMWFVLRRDRAGRDEGAIVDLAYEFVDRVDASGEPALKRQPIDDRYVVTGRATDAPIEKLQNRGRDIEEGATTFVNAKGDRFCITCSRQSVTIGVGTFETFQCMLVHEPERSEFVTRLMPVFGGVQWQTTKGRWQILAWGATGGAEKPIGARVR